MTHCEAVVNLCTDTEGRGKQVMRNAVAIVIVLIFFGAGCSGPFLRAQGGPVQRPRTRDASAADVVYETADLPARTGVGVLIGSTLESHYPAVDKFRHTRFESGALVGGSVLYVLGSRDRNMRNTFIMRYGFEGRIEAYDLDLVERGFDYGRLCVRSGILAFNLMWVPGERRVFGFHFEGGIGWGDSTFRKDTMLKLDDAAAGIYTTIQTGAATILSGGAGADFYLMPDVCMSVIYRYAGVYIPVDWDESGISRSDIDFLNASNQQLVLSLRYLF